MSSAGEHDLATLLRSVEPVLRDGTWVFVTGDVPAGVVPLATFVEDEGLSLLIRREDADAAGLAYDFVGAWISLSVHSALDAVGLTAAVAGALAAAGISANVVAARYHDHVLVPVDRAEETVRIVAGLGGAASGAADPTDGEGTDDDAAGPGAQSSP
ncbi:hypothetical protein CLV28_1494 [Sediminihabitans luteus]|uniref:Uncharacterized protein n=1 Tax=Sediminihabitans luteus TaxID=1138585 RepID=A0A2M9CQ03_9CELL|nr:ACT domain-containing protein [Sediminihabitans luteus]PJJ74006.1 hypothetical protein CLV28_1494 [Sediminihabitans luteus]GII98080.1 transporter [Sediminihabitans luteus]